MHATNTQPRPNIITILDALAFPWEPGENHTFQVTGPDCHRALTRMSPHAWEASWKDPGKPARTMALNDHITFHEATKTLARWHLNRALISHPNIPEAINLLGPRDPGLLSQKVSQAITQPIPCFETLAELITYLKRHKPGLLF